jgi:hypothetical protein
VANSFRRLVQGLAAVCAALFLICSAGASSDSAQPNPAPGDQPSGNIGDDWDSLLKDTIPQNTPDEALTSAKTSYAAGPVGDFTNHFFFNNRTEYLHTQTYFTGLPTATGVINAPPSAMFNPAGIPYPPAFQSSTNDMYSVLNFGTRGWISNRVSTNFLLLYGQDITNVTNASPQLSIIDTFGSNRQLQLMTGYVQIDGLPTDGLFAGTSLRLGRQDVYGAELAEMDGASFTMDRPRYSWTIYAGRRYTYYSDPNQRAIGGGNFVFRIGKSSTFEYDTLYYIKGTNVFSYRQTIGNAWLFGTSFRMVGSSATDFAANAQWAPEDGKTSLFLSFAQKITANDYFYDYTYNARTTDPYNQTLRLNLGALYPYSQFVIDGSRAINDRIRLGGIIWIRALNNLQNKGPFETSFQDYRAFGQFYLWKNLELFASYRQRNSDDRYATVPPTDFSDLSNTGETRNQDVAVEIGRSFLDGRLVLRAGGYFRNLNFVDQFTIISNAHDKGVLGSAIFKINNRSQLYFDYDLDTDYPVFRPDIQNSQMFRFGLAWSY